MSSERQTNYVNEIQNRVQNLYYVDDASELNSIDLKENDKIYAINDNKLFQMEITDQEEELSGSVVSFKGRNNTKIKSVVADIRPVQDLHGYDNPWPAGGGKNKFDVNSATVYKRYVNTTSNIWKVSSDSRSYAFPCDPNTTYTISCTGNKISIFRTGYITEPTIPQTGDIAIYSIDWKTEAGSRTITTGENATFIIIQFNASVIDNKSNYLQIELGSAATSYAPYSNECPISGWTGLNAWNESTYDPTAQPKLQVLWSDTAGTVYGGNLTVNEDGSGVLTADKANIASYAGEAISGEWISDRDVYAPGRTPTIGAQVVYSLTTPLIYTFTNLTQLTTLLGTNNIWSDIGDITVKIAEKGITAFELKSYN